MRNTQLSIVIGGLCWMACQGACEEAPEHAPSAGSSGTTADRSDAEVVFEDCGHVWCGQDASSPNASVVTSECPSEEQLANPGVAVCPSLAMSESCNDGIYQPGELCFRSVQIGATQTASGSLRPERLAVADLDRDGFADVVVTYRAPSAASDVQSTTFWVLLYFGQAEGLTEPVWIDSWQANPPPTASVSGPIGVADLDADGWIDVFFEREALDSQVEAAVYFGEGERLFESVRIISLRRGSANAKIAAADLDATVGRDLLVTGEGGAWLTQARPRVYELVEGPFTLGPDTQIANTRVVRDTDGDSNLDFVGFLVGPGFDSDTAYLVRRMEGGDSEEPLPLPDGIAQGYLGVGELSGDGMLDLLGLANEQDTASSIHLTASLALSTAERDYDAVAPIGLAPLMKERGPGISDVRDGDLDGDGADDFVFAMDLSAGATFACQPEAPYRALRILLGDRTVGVREPTCQPALQSSFAAGVDVGDLDANGHLDIVAALANGSLELLMSTD